MTSAASSSLLQPVDISDLEQGNTGIPFAHRLESGQTGPAVLVTALVHGNELCGAHALRRFFDQAIRPTRGSITLCVCNVAAYRSFDPLYPARSRFIDEDFNRVWDKDVLDGGRSSVELDRARQIRPLLDEADMLLDLHSMQTDCEPLMLSGVQPHAQQLARDMGFPRIIFADTGHAAGLRMRDYGHFGEPGTKAAALLAECGQHLDPAAAGFATEILSRFLLSTGVISHQDAARLSDLPERTKPLLIEGTGRITVRNADFRFEGDPQSLDVIPSEGSLIALDGDQPVRTPHDKCVLIMPSRRLIPGQTAVRLGRYVD
jgi:predicted deacylase